MVSGGRKRGRKQEPGGFHINWKNGETAHFVVETKNGPIHFGIRMGKRPRKGIQLLQGPDKRVRWIPKN